MTHTPGPWVWDADKRLVTVARDARGCIPVVSATGGYYGDDGIEVDEDDARLIAAAPELLAACNLMEEYERLMGAGQDVAAMDAYARAAEARKAAIAKAEGRDQ